MSIPTATTSQLQAGAACVTITPPIGGRMQSGARDRFAEGILDDLYARALVHDDGVTRLALITADVIGFEPESTAVVRRAVEATTGIPATQVMLCASHTHSGPATLWRGVDPCDPHYLEVLEQQLTGVVQVAARQVRPADVYLGEGTVPFAINRRLNTAEGSAWRPNPLGAVDRRARVLALYPAGDAERGVAHLAVVMHAVCHPTVLTTPSRVYSGDYPSTAQAVLESVNAGDPGEPVTLFVQGCCGDVRANVTPPDGGTFRYGFAPDVRRVGRMFGGQVVTAVAGASPLTATLLAAASYTVTLPYTALPSRADIADPTYRLGRPRAGMPWHPRNDEWVARLTSILEQGGTFAESEEAELQVFRLGDLLLIALPGEPFVEIGLAIEQQLRGAAPACTVLVAGYTNNVCGYLCTAAAFAEGGYEPVQSYQPFGRPAPFAPVVETILREAGVHLGRALLSLDSTP
jgi:hypothetical protein